MSQLYVNCNVPTFYAVINFMHKYISPLLDFKNAIKMALIEPTQGILLILGILKFTRFNYFGIVDYDCLLDSYFVILLIFIMLICLI